MFPSYPKAILALADGTFFIGNSIGATGQTVGELVFNTSITGYQEIMTDLSYHKQILTFTYPHIGNYGVNSQDVEAKKVAVAGILIKDLPLTHSNFRATKSLSDYLKENNVIGISNIDTRKLTRLLRDNGAQNAAIISLNQGEEITQQVKEQALQLAKQAPNMEGLDLAKEVSIVDKETWVNKTWDLKQGYTQQQDFNYHVVVLDFGSKYNILRLLSDRHCKITLVPATTKISEILSLNPDGVLLSNGPGDPSACDYAIETIKQLLENNIPLFGICLGHQLLALACGAKTYKMKFGHHGANHPVKDIDSGRVNITSQNHGFSVDIDTLPEDLKITHYSLFDNSLQGIEHKVKPAFSFQGHPEASPGPHDIEYLFDKFIKLMDSNKEKNNG